MPRRFRRKKSKFVTRRALPFLIQRQAEAKYRTGNIVGLDMTAPLPEENEITAMGTGVNRSDRNGNQIQVTGVYARGFFSPNHDDTIPTNSAYMGRVVLYTPRNVTDVLDVLPGEAIDKELYIIWYDRLVHIPWTNSVTGNTFTIKKSFKPYMKVTYDSSGTTSVVKNPLKILISCNSPTNFVTLDYHWKLYYRDM